MKINVLAQNSGSKEINQSQPSLDVLAEREIEEIGMGVLSDGTPYLNQRGLAGLCGVENAHIGSITQQWHDDPAKPRVAKIKSHLEKLGLVPEQTHVEVHHRGKTHFCYPVSVCLAVMRYYAFDAGANSKEVARDNFSLLAGDALQRMIFSQVGYDPSKGLQEPLRKWHERIELNYQSAPRGYFSVFNEAHTVIYELIKSGANIGEKIVPDGSMGIHWGNFWKQHKLSEKFGVRKTWPHRYPDDFPQAKSNPQPAKCYPISALPEFRRWLYDDYLNGGAFERYITGKHKGQYRLPPSVAQIALDRITPKELPEPDDS